MKLRAAILPFIILTISIAAFGQAEGRHDRELKALIQRMADAQIAFDVKTLDAVLAPDYIEISPLGEVDPREKVLGFYKPEMRPPGGMSGKAEFSEISIRDYGKAAILIVRATFTATVNGKAMPPRSLRAVFVCRHLKDGWKIVSGQYTGIRPKSEQLPKKDN
ncbi:MAG: hypothetical protein UZ17_ACD001001611 [Acidobacteria bacterium OLB17]|nr:MAG: hypothetical protein UZ17_ACD001001611 [Acidobacteria bacterium OLB17]MCZ2391411.1 nuclear transport factor 2 family protein [Acidobacteriota bacterium]